MSFRNDNFAEPPKIVGQLILAVSLVAVAFTCAASVEGGPGEDQFEALRQRFQAGFDKYLADYQKAKTNDERWELYDRSPSNTMVDDFLALEAAHRGTPVGISALHHLVSQSGGGAAPNTPVLKGREAALRILAAHYGDHPDLDVITELLMSGSLSSESKPFLRRAAQSPHRHVRAAALFTLGRIFAAEAQVPAWLDANLALLESEPEKYANDIKLYTEIRNRWGNVNVVESRGEAMRLLDQVINEYGEVLETPRTPRGPILLRVERLPEDQLTRQRRRPLGENAEATRFALTQLSSGQPAPEIAGPDALGNELKLSDQRGKVTVIMFSYKGCIPCESMYPDNRKLIETYHGRPFAFVGIMGDDTLDTVKEAVEEKKITWPVWWDGRRNGPLATRWNVSGWPEIYVLDHRGIIRYRELRGEVLAKAVAKLVQEAERAR